VRRLAPPIAVLLLITFAAPAGAVNIGAAGDISNPPGGGRADVQTARLLTTGNGIGLVLALGDTQYECGEPDNFRAAYDLSWGQVRSITRPSVGNHEYQTGASCRAPQPQAQGYYEYFAGRTPPHPGYYSFDFQGWHFVVLNTWFGVVPGGATGEQLAWFKQDLAANRAKRCTVVYSHFPYLSSANPTYGWPDVRHYWPIMVLEDVDLYLAAHNHGYERMAAVRTAGNVDNDFGPADGDDGHMGVPTTIVGTGGRSLINFTRIHPRSLVRRLQFGILKIVPNYPAAGQWVQAFKGTDGSTFDRKTFSCH
jgi:acid phosphatase type 7